MTDGGSMYLALGDFVFEASQTPWQTTARNSDYRVASHERVGDRPLLQYVGPGEDEITVTGVCYPQVTSGAEGIEQLRTLAEAGESYVLVDSNGWVYGMFAITNISETQSCFVDGMAQKIEFSLKLKRDIDKVSSTGYDQDAIYIDP